MELRRGPAATLFSRRQRSRIHHLHLQCMRYRYRRLLLFERVLQYCCCCEGGDCCCMNECYNIVVVVKVATKLPLVSSGWNIIGHPALVVERWSEPLLVLEDTEQENHSNLFFNGVCPNTIVKCKCVSTLVTKII